MAKRYQMPADGYIPVVKRGDFPHSCGVVQRIDDAAILSMYDNWKESGKPIPMGIDHFDGLSNEQRAGLKALDIQLPSDAVAWINDLQIRGDTLYGKPVFNSENVAESGAYRMISPTFPTRGLEIVDREKKIVRPTILKNVSFTNEPNCRSIPMISNRNYEAFLMNKDNGGDVRGDVIDLQNSGTSEGAEKGWETRKSAGQLIADHEAARNNYFRARAEHEVASNAAKKEKDLISPPVKRGMTHDEIESHVAKESAIEDKHGVWEKYDKRLNAEHAVIKSAHEIVKRTKQYENTPDDKKAEIEKVYSSGLKYPSIREKLIDSSARLKPTEKELTNRELSRSDLANCDASMFADKDLLAKAKAHISKSKSEDDESFWPEVTAHYRELGGKLDNSTGDNMKNDLSSFFAVLANRTSDQIESAIENGDYPGHPFHGNQYVGGSGGSSEESSINADKRSKETRGLKEGTKEYSDAHSKAASAHEHAAKKAREDENDARADYHDRMAKFHGDNVSKLWSGISAQQKELKKGTLGNSALDNKASDEMKNELATILNIKPDAPEADFIAGVKTLANRAVESDKAAHKAKVAAALTEFAPVIANREQAEAALTANFDATVAAFKLIKSAAKLPADFQNRFKPGALPDFKSDETSLVAQIEAATNEIQNRENCSGVEALQRLQTERPDLYAKACLPKA